MFEVSDFRGNLWGSAHYVRCCVMGTLDMLGSNFSSKLILMGIWLVEMLRFLVDVVGSGSE